MPETKNKVTEIKCLENNDFNPILANFQNGEILNEGASKLICNYAADNSRKDAKMFLAASEQTVYSGYIGENTSNLVNTFIAIRNKTTNKVRLVQVEECSLLPHHIVQHRTESLMKSTTNLEANRILMKKFGGKKSIRMLDCIEKMKVNIDVVKDQLDSTVNTLSELKKKEDTSIEQTKPIADNILPPRNENATKIEELYSIEDIISSNILKDLQPVALGVLKTVPEKLPIRSNFCLAIIRKIQQSQDVDSVENLNKTKACIYLDALLHLVKKVKRNSTFKNVTLSDICDIVEVDIKKNFVQPNNAKVLNSSYTMRKAFAYILILSLLVSNKLEICVDEMVLEMGTTKTVIIKFAKFLELQFKDKGNFLKLRMPSSGKKS